MSMHVDCSIYGVWVEHVGVRAWLVDRFGSPQQLVGDVAVALAVRGGLFNL